MPNLVFAQTCYGCNMSHVYDTDMRPIKEKTDIVTPLKQFKAGFTFDNITCKKDLVKIMKSKDGSPACVKPQTAQKLVERNWGKIISSDVQYLNKESICKANGGEWSQTFLECTNVSNEICTILNGSYHECASSCRHEPSQRNGELMGCTGNCVRLCSLK